MVTANKRVPLSCEPCRERKIRCYRNSPGSSRTCDTCVRRGVPLEECVFLRDLPRSQRPVGRRPPRPSSISEGAANRELFSRIEKLESLLSSSGRVTGENTDSAPTTSSREHPSTSSLSPSMPNMYGRVQRLPSTETGSHRKLSRTASGHERYESFPSVLPTRPHDEAAGNTTTSTRNKKFPFTTTTSPLSELLLLLPPLKHCDALKDLYFRVFGSLFHVLHDPTFEEEYAAFRANPHGASLSWLALLYAVLAVAVTAMDETDDVLQDLGKHADPLDNFLHLTSTYRAAAMRCLDTDQYLWQHNLRTLQTLVLLIYGVSHSHGPSWAMLGIARNIAQSIGCHLDPDEFDLDIVEAEQRRRCWAALCMLYTVQNATLGSIDPSPLPRNVKLPLDLDDDDLGRPRRSSCGPTQMTYLLFKFRLYDLFARISVIMGDRSTSPIYEDVANLDDEIGVQQDLWSARYLADTREGSLPDYHAAHLQILSGYAHQLRLLLHRPVIAQQQDPRPADRRRYSPAQLSRSRDRCIESARALLDIHGFLHDSPEMRPYQWYNRGLGSFHAFHAAATIAFIGETCTSVPVQEMVQLGQDLDNAAMVFRSISDSGMSVICRKALPVVQQFQKRINSLNLLHGHLPQPVPEHGFGVDMGLVSPASQGRNQPEHMESPKDYTLYADAMFANMQAPQWLSPSTVTWDTWNDLVAGV